MRTLIAVHAFTGTPMSPRAALRLVAPVALAVAVASPALAKSPRTQETMSAYARSAPTYVKRSPHAVYRRGYKEQFPPRNQSPASLLFGNNGY